MSMSNPFFDCLQTEAQSRRTTCPKLLAKTAAELDQTPGLLAPTVLCHLRSEPVDRGSWRCGGWDQLFELVPLRAFMWFLSPTLSAIDPLATPPPTFRSLNAHLVRAQEHPEKTMCTQAQSPVIFRVTATKAHMGKCTHRLRDPQDPRRPLHIPPPGRGGALSPWEIVPFFAAGDVKVSGSAGEGGWEAH